MNSMRLLLDTHVLLWQLSDDPHQKPTTHAMIADPSNEIFVSACSVWEISIKQAAKKIEAPDDLLAQLVDHELVELPISAAHALRAGGLPPHHGDPFDRMLVAQAQVEGLTLVSKDRQLAAYDVALHPA